MKQNTSIRSLVTDIEALGDKYLVREAPFQLPTEIKDLIVKIAYPLAVVGAVLMGVALIMLIPVMIAYMGISVLVMPFSGPRMVGFDLIGLILAALNVYVLVLSIKWYYAALPGLKAHTRAGWEYVFYGSLLGVVSSLINSHSIMGIFFSIGPALVSLIISMYLWFQVKDRYTHHKA
ncbi:MAG: hypothetical protein WCJ70_02295 [bacterium]